MRILRLLVNVALSERNASNDSNLLSFLKCLYFVSLMPVSCPSTPVLILRNIFFTVNDASRK